MAIENQAADELIKFARHFKSLLATVDKLNEIGSLEDAANAARVRKTEVENEIAALGQQKQALLDELTQVRTDIADADLRAARTREAAIAEGVAIVDQANVEAQNLVSAAKQTVERLQNSAKEAQEQVEIADATRRSLLVEVDSLLERRRQVVEHAQQLFKGVES